jgi:hypothetical protein
MWERSTVPGDIDIWERLGRVRDLREMLKYERQHWVAAIAEDPLSVETFIYGLSIDKMQAELQELQAETGF